MDGPCDQHHRDPGACARLDRDPGASPERTRLAWRRTGLSAAAVGLLIARPAFSPDAGPAEFLVAAAAMAGWAVMVALAFHRAAQLRSRFPGTSRPTIFAYALVIGLLAVLGGWVVTL